MHSANPISHGLKTPHSTNEKCSKNNSKRGGGGGTPLNNNQSFVTSE